MRSERKRKKRAWLIGAIIVFLALIGTYVFSVYYKLQQTMNEMNEPIERERSDKRPDALSFTEKQPISILLIGVDERKNDRGRADSLIVITVNPKKQSMEMLSIPRDTRTMIVGKGKEDKINHSYAFGGVEMTLATVEQFLDIPIDYYIKVNMESFKDIVDAVGGVTVNNPLHLSMKENHFRKGKLR
ncbi:Transcriptional regulator LytR [Anoxybacillus sp. BCO1]|nr:Transcriptional regulator LytR [Anoxybacillus sp. BCO1]